MLAAERRGLAKSRVGIPRSLFGLRSCMGLGFYGHYNLLGEYRTTVVTENYLTTKRRTSCCLIAVLCSYTTTVLESSHGNCVKLTIVRAYLCLHFSLISF
ncbi:hypothetical protein BDY19DRAFT_603274 [Irpex rosettiformis]|uniref:Uncharacterized protein n=1 Tax=Irpex rosettiformis TaxID=378272 RepID=A0ACB8TPR0_9APHY|nr:hypothetical protein BDY19DRAFT_603274 [Irpex rosettiformis]